MRSPFSNMTRRYGISVAFRDLKEMIYYFRKDSEIETSSFQWRVVKGIPRRPRQSIAFFRTASSA